MCHDSNIQLHLEIDLNLYSELSFVQHLIVDSVVAQIYESVFSIFCVHIFNNKTLIQCTWHTVI